MPRPDPAPSSDPDDLERAGPALFRLGRTFGRPRPRALDAKKPVDLSRIHLVEVLVDHGDVPIGEVAARLGIDASTASRLVAGATAEGLVKRRTADDDARRARLTLTAKGRKLAADARAYQRQVFDELTAGWPADERETFARLFVRFAQGLAP